jgi:transcriptional regulator with XRE-family HTH domain
MAPVDPLEFRVLLPRENTVVISLAAGHPRRMHPKPLQSLGANLAHNLREIRELRGLTQAQLASLCEVPRSTVANIEAGGSNPTLSVLARLASSLHLSLEEMLARPRARCELFEPGSLPENEYRRSGLVRLRHLLPHPIPGMAIERMELDPGARFAGSPHPTGTQEFLCCEKGRIKLWVAGETFDLERGAVAAFSGDQRHSYLNPGKTLAVGFSVVSLEPISRLGAVSSS